VSDTERGYTITRIFDAPRQLVWDAWTQPEHFAVWFGTAEVPMDDVELDVRPGGAWKGRMTYAGTAIHWRGIYREVVEPERLVVDLTDGTGGPDDYETYTVILSALDDERTEMVLRQSGGHLTDEGYEEAKVGTSSFMDAMDDLLVTLKERHG
jgi:uncharacterized protein YndB with AHSA1/START domain